MPEFHEIINKLFEPDVRRRGMRFFRSGRVQKFYLSGFSVTASVFGKTENRVKLVFDYMQNPKEIYCTCLEFESKFCRHSAAVMIRLNTIHFFTSRYPIRYFKDTDVTPQDELLNSSSEEEPDEAAEFEEEIYEYSGVINEGKSNKQVKNQWLKEIDEKRKSADINKFRENVAGLIYTAQPAVKQPNQYKLAFGLQLTGTQTSLVVLRQRIKKDGTVGEISIIQDNSYSGLDISDLNDKLVLSLVSKRFGEFTIDIVDPQHMEKYHLESLPNQALLSNILEYLEGKDVYLYQKFKYSDVRLNITKEKAAAELVIEDSGPGLNLYLYILFGENKIRVDEKVIPVLSEPLWVRYEEKIFEIKNLSYSQLKSFIAHKGIISIPGFYLEIFEQQYIPRIIKNLQISSPVYEVEKINVTPVKRIYLEETDDNGGKGSGTINIKVKFGYADYELDADSTEYFHSFVKGKKVFSIIRNKDFEEGAEEEIKSFNVKQIKPGSFSPKGRILEFLFHFIPAVKEAGFEIYGENSLTKFKINATKPVIKVSVLSGIDWFDVKFDIDFGGIKVSAKSLARSLKQNKKFIQLDDGSVGLLPEDWIDKLKRFFNFGAISDSKISGDELVRFNSIQSTLIEEIFLSADEKTADEKFNEQLNRLKSFERIEEKEPPGKYKEILRPYQKFGYSWLYFLKEYNFGGILADDMGLGKTIQILALLQNERKLNAGVPSLVIAPTSVVFNWLAESEKFPGPDSNEPGLNILNHTGASRNKKELEIFSNYDVVITSYGTLLQDLRMFLNMEFNYIIFDESQKIKNPSSKSAKAARALKGRHKLCLTGTPVENNLDELWSQFAVTNPGLLGSHSNFRESVILPIQKHSDKNAAEFLKKTIYPFVLRRTKDKVAKELPPKTNVTLYCGFEPEQEVIYNEWRDSIREEIIKAVDESGLGKSGLQVLEGLLRLRQICNHPVLVKEAYKKKSGKFEKFKEKIEEAVEEGHKVLVFSQFVQMLEIIRKFLDSRRIKYEYLTGNTRNREEAVNNFQNNSKIKVFLISLKAGGFGLNLTAADYVFHYDPWWNPAIESQATDRAYRIGQDKNVFVYKFITKDSVEEKILQLQEKKTELVESILDSEGGVIKNITKEDIEVLFS